MLGLNHEMLKGLIERYGTSAAMLAVVLGFLPGDYATLSCTTESGATVSTIQIAAIAGILIMQTFLGVKVNTQNSLVNAAKSAVEATSTATPAIAKVAAETAVELKAKAQ